MDRLPTGKAPGYDSISGHCVKSVKQYIGAPLTTLVNRMFTEHLFPDPLKKADVTPIYKKDNKLTKGNYRPVSVLITFSKMFEMAMSDQMDPHQKKTHLSPPSFGIHKKHWMWEYSDLFTGDLATSFRRRPVCRLGDDGLV